jgi:uncharacterized protein (TIGR02231 family)
MKTIPISLGLLLLALRLPAQEPVDAKSKITQATVFLQSAQLTREAQLQVKQGDNVFRFQGLETSIDPQSIQAAAPEIVLINSVKHEVNYQTELPTSPEYRAIADSIKLTTDAITRTNSANGVLEAEKTLLNQNLAIGSKEKGLTTETLQKMADFYRSRMTYIQEEQFKQSITLRELNKTLARLNQQLGTLQGRSSKPSNDIILHLKSDYARSVTVLLRYVISGASWQPSYDLRATDLTKPVRLDYRAEVFQSTGNDWENVQLTLSTGNPNLGGTKPELSQWNLYPAGYGVKTLEAVTISTQGDYDESRDYKKEEKPTDGRFGGGMTLADYTTVTEGAVTAEFAINVPQRIPSDGKGHQVFIQSTDLPATFAHYAVPKLDADAFLLAAVTGWESLNLLPGGVNIFFEGTYVTRAQLNPSATSDTLNLSLGRDPKVIIARKPLQDKSSQRTIGTNKERTFAYEITVRNAKTTPITLRLLDQVPVSQDESVTVKVEEISGASHNTDTGELTWNLALQPNETKKLTLIYSVKYPKSKVINGI